MESATRAPELPVELTQRGEQVGVAVRRPVPAGVQAPLETEDRNDLVGLGRRYQGRVVGHSQIAAKPDDRSHLRRNPPSGSLRPVIRPVGRMRFRRVPLRAGSRIGAW